MRLRAHFFVSKSVKRPDCKGFIQPNIVPNRSAAIWPFTYANAFSDPRQVSFVLGSVFQVPTLFHAHALPD